MPFSGQARYVDRTHHINLSADSRSLMVVYIFSSTQESSRLSDQEKFLLKHVQRELSEHNRFFQEIGALTERMTESNSVPQFRIAFTNEKGTHTAPTAVTHEGMILDLSEPPVDTNTNIHREVTVILAGNHERVKSINSFYDPLMYPVYNVTGNAGWQYGTERQQSSSKTTKRLSCQDYYAYKAHTRDKKGEVLLYDIVLSGGLLCHQYWIDMFCKMEEERLNYIRHHQSTIKAEVREDL
jgi:hypothetical protein